MRLIDADAIYQWYTDAFDFSPNEIRFSMNDIRDNLYNIPTVDAVPREQYESMEETCYKLQQALKEANNWIPCSERLPDKDGDYLVVYDKIYANDNDYDRIVSIAPFAVASKAFGYWYQHLGTNGWLVNDLISIPVVAWIPLPEPYEGDDHE